MSEEVEKDTGEDSKELEKNYIPGRPYSRLRRELSEEDLTNPAVQKLIISDIDKLEVRISWFVLQVLKAEAQRIVSMTDERFIKT